MTKPGFALERLVLGTVVERVRNDGPQWIGDSVSITRRTEITIEMDRIFVIRRRGEPVQAQCAECGEQTKMVTADEAAANARVSSRTIYRWIETEKIHFMESREGALLICLRSLGRL